MAATDVDSVLEEAEGLLEDMQDLEGKISEAETDEEREKLEDRLEAKDQEFQRVEDRLERAKSRQDRQGKLEDFKADLQTDDAGKTMAPGDGGDGEPSAGKEPAQPTDEEREARAEIRAFLDYLNGKELSGQQNEALAPQSDNWKEGSGGKRVPPSLLQVFFGERWAKSVAQGKALLSSGTSEANLVDEDYRAELLELEPEPGHLLGRVTIVPTDSGTIKIPRLEQSDSDEYGGVSFSWIDEGGTKPETEPTFEQVEIATHECSGYTEMSKTMIGRSEIGLIALLRRLYRSAARAEIDSMILGGDGVGEPLGIINTAGIRTVGRAAADDVDYEDLVNLKHAVLPHHRDQASFMVHDDVELNLELDTDADDRPLFTASTADGPYDQLVGYPYEVTLRQPSIGSDGDVIYGDPSWYYLAQEQEMVIETSRHYRFRNNLQAFTLYMLIGGRLVEPRAMAILVGSSS